MRCAVRALCRQPAAPEEAGLVQRLPAGEGHPAPGAFVEGQVAPDHIDHLVYRHLLSGDLAGIGGAGGKARRRTAGTAPGR